MVLGAPSHQTPASNSREFQLHDRKLVLPSVTDQFKSIKVEDEAQVFAWQALFHTGIYTQWKGDHSDITDAPGGLTRVAVAHERDVAVTFFFKDKTHHENEQYTLTVQSSDDLSVVLHPETNEGRLVAIMPFKSRPLGAFLEVKDKRGRDVIRRAMIGLAWDFKEPGQIDITFEGSKPKELEVDRNGATSFTISLTD
ncbi:hypothetical protein VTI74DRAFT_4728 [Chaetomium olivicolor]